MWAGQNLFPHNSFNFFLVFFFCSLVVCPNSHASDLGVYGYLIVLPCLIFVNSRHFLFFFLLFHFYPPFGRSVNYLCRIIIERNWDAGFICLSLSIFTVFK
uniref:Ras-related protein n=1 Tax=Rhizophora mucronata TaxID=61149 RepID=A0A2P2K6A4_RHIMU